MTSIGVFGNSGSPRRGGFQGDSEGWLEEAGRDISLGPAVCCGPQEEDILEI